MKVRQVHPVPSLIYLPIAFDSQPVRAHLTVVLDFCEILQHAKCKGFRKILHLPSNIFFILLKPRTSRSNVIIMESVQILERQKFHSLDNFYGINFRFSLRKEKGSFMNDSIALYITAVICN